MLRLFSPAKVNLFLKVNGRRADGYHDLTTVFQSLDFGDYVSFSSDSRLTLIAPASVPQGQDNLAWRAADLFFAAAQKVPRMQLKLEKNIPVQAGLGGGSSNAATVLRGLNALHGLPLSPKRMHQLAAELGSDVPFFLRGGTAWGRGRGDELTTLPDLPEFWVRLVQPDFGLSTAEVYRSWQGVSGACLRDAEAALCELDLDKLMYNDLERPAFALRPALAALKQRLIADGADAALLSGSGSVVFGVYAQKPLSIPVIGGGFTEWLVRTLPAYDIIE